MMIRSYIFCCVLWIGNAYHNLHRHFSVVSGARNSRRLSVLREKDASVATIIGDTFVSAWRNALKGDQVDLKALLVDNAAWNNPYVSSSNELFEALKSFSSFFEDPSLTVFSVTGSTKDEIKLNYQISFWYPMPWRPRIIIPGEAIVKICPESQRITSVSEEWAMSVPQIMLTQFLPRFWDIWHLFCSPSPEHAPRKVLGSVGKISFVEVSENVQIEVRWSCDAKFPGPPLQILPGFSLFGELRTSKPKRDPFYTVLPVEVNAGRSVCSDTGSIRKVYSWKFEVPTSLREKVWEKASTETRYPIIDADDADVDDKVEEADYQVGATIFPENVSFMKSVTGGILRGDIAVDEDYLKAFASSEKKEYFYQIAPKRIIAETSIAGEVTQDKISEALKTLKAAVFEHGSKIVGRPVRLRPRTIDDTASKDPSPLVGLQLWNCKAAFNAQGEPAMAIYEIQYGLAKTKVHVELLQS